eukprot:1143765-Pelagomonas_calceolata.AAC.3
MAMEGVVQWHCFGKAGDLDGLADLKPRLVQMKCFLVAYLKVWIARSAGKDQPCHEQDSVQWNWQPLHYRAPTSTQQIQGAWQIYMCVTSARLRGQCPMDTDWHANPFPYFFSIYARRLWKL